MSSSCKDVFDLLPKKYIGDESNGFTDNEVFDMAYDYISDLKIGLEAKNVILEKDSRLLDTLLDIAERKLSGRDMEEFYEYAEELNKEKNR